MVACPSEPGALAEQTLYSSENCTGEPVSSLVPTSAVHCPGKEYYSPDSLDLERLVLKLQRDHTQYVPDEATARGALKEYVRMLHLIQQFPDEAAVPSKLVDLVWHEHILDTLQYRIDSQKLFGKYLHHAPSFGDDADGAVVAEKRRLRAQQDGMLHRYAQLFGQEPDADVWSLASKPMGEGRLPDCCKAQCAKVNCVSCVGCNAVDCGKLLQGDEEARGRMAPVIFEDLADYVPHLGDHLSQDSTQDQTYLCQMTPMVGMTFSWTIADQSVYMKQTLETAKAETWHSIGFPGSYPYDMGNGADYILSFFGTGLGSNNYTGLRDLYRPDEGNHYPCWDVLTQCSTDGKAGTMDIHDGSVARENGVSTSTWNRLLVTPDKKDAPITTSSQKVMFAYGFDDQFTYHGTDRWVKCDMNFYTGSNRCSGGSHHDD